MRHGSVGSISMAACWREEENTTEYWWELEQGGGCQEELKAKGLGREGGEILCLQV